MCTGLPTAVFSLKVKKHLREKSDQAEGQPGIWFRSRGECAIVTGGHDSPGCLFTEWSLDTGAAIAILY